MEPIFAELSASITELKKNPGTLIDQAGKDVVAILKRNRPAAYLVPAETFEKILDILEDIELSQIIHEREHEKPYAVEVSIDDL